jgi:hypothetical protein
VHSGSSFDREAPSPLSGGRRRLLQASAGAWAGGRGSGGSGVDGHATMAAAQAGRQRGCGWAGG